MWHAQEFGLLYLEKVVVVYYGHWPFLSRSLVPQRNNDQNYRYWHRKLTQKLWLFLLHPQHTNVSLAIYLLVQPTQDSQRKVSGLITNFNISNPQQVVLGAAEKNINYCQSNFYTEEKTQCKYLLDEEPRREPSIHLILDFYILSCKLKNTFMDNL